ncbi:helix-turn-helix domain-containing protein [Luteimonas sp. SJ-92]|uniref:Helix-turn-helix domain-containing protein n=1 Tax=Luteimonas salinisoli TaxID=2752307 RepID=A0A853JD11_9GAMM|nr:helix-turn-helix transcriptional regulator [Luteimonas salinisoli]NZA26468.1 helix-turn-helix domain-containing protein [Luteimonas salinisoli]
MTGHNLARTRSDLAAFLVRQRNRLTPADVGLPSTGRRRTPGLRREEVAMLAGVGLTWYTWFEQGRDIDVSESFLLGVASALRLDDAECCHLFLLAHRRPPPVEAYREQAIPALVQTLMDEMARPAYVMNLRWDVVAWNAAADTLFGFAARQPGERNMMSLLFADPAFRRRLPDWRQDAARLLAQFRCDLAGAPEHPAMLELVEALRKLSPDFRRWWEQPSLEAYGYGIGTIVDADSNHGTYDHAMLLVDEHRHLRMVAYLEKMGSGSFVRRSRRLRPQRDE